MKEQIPAPNIAEEHHHKDLDLTKDQIKEYYKNHSIRLPEKPNRRQYRIVTYEGDMRKIKRQIHKPEELQPILIKETPIAVYYTHSYFLAPDRVRSKNKNLKPGYKWLDNIFLGSDYVIDFDEEHSEEMNIANTIQMLREEGFQDMELRQTGNGFHLIVKDFTKRYCKQNIPNPKDRENHHKQKKEKLTTKLKNKGAKFDYPISIDTRRIIRLPNSLHQNGTIIRKIPLNDMSSERKNINHTHSSQKRETRQIRLG